MLRGHDGWVGAVAVGALADGTPVVVSGGDDGSVRVWRLADGSAVAEPFDVGAGIQAVAWVSGTMLASSRAGLLALQLLSSGRP